MKITEQHANGASITVSGFRAASVVERWRRAQDGVEPESVDEGPKVTGTTASAERASGTSYSTLNGSGYRNPTVFGFTVEDQS